MKTLLTLAVAVCTFLASAALPASLSGPLSRHLAEVNAEWNHHPRTLARLTDEVQFASDGARIQAHLTQVIGLVEQNTAQSSTHTGHRTLMMQQLRAYAEAGVFPQNNLTAERHPVFIDERGVHCAVGHLMLVNGFGDLARAVKDWDNLTYVRQIPEAWLSDWMAFSGLTVDEMALIQPGYLPSQTWASYGGNFQGEVTDVIVYSGETIICGQFDFDGQFASLARLVNDVFIPLTGASGVGYDMEIFDGNLYVAGQFGAFDLAVVEADWSINFEAVSSSKYPMGYCLLAAEGELYLAAHASGFVMMSTIHRFDGNAWSNIGVGSYQTHALAWYNGKLVAAGEPGNIYDAEGNQLSVALWDGTNWEQAGNGIQDPVYGLTVIDNVLYACGKAFDMGTFSFGVGKFDGGDWDLISEDTWEFYYGNVLPTVETMVFRGFGKVNEVHYLHGTIPSSLFMMIYGSGIISFHPEIDFPLGTPAFPPLPTGQSVNSMAFDGQKVWAGGNFDSEIIAPMQRIASSDDFVISVPEFGKAETLQLYPNPTNGPLNVRFEKGRFATYELLNAMGQTVASGRLQSESDALNIDVRGRAAGLYHLRLSGRGGTVTGTLVVE